MRGEGSGGEAVVIVATAHKVGSTWMCLLLQLLGVGSAGAQLPKHVMEAGDTLVMNEESLALVGEMEGPCHLKSHTALSNEEAARWLRPNTKVVTVLRDPRDVVVSTAFYVPYISEEDGGLGSFDTSDEAGLIRRTITEYTFSLEELEVWARSDFALKVKYERMLESAPQVLEEVLGFIGVERTREQVELAVESAAFERLAKRSAGQELRGAFFRKGIAGDWKNYFDQESVELFKTSQGGRWNRLLVEMGYESTVDWTL